MTRTLLLRLAATQQSWGGPATQRWRPTEKIPTRAGLEGLLHAALGLPRGETSSVVAALSMHVRVDRAGSIGEDFHTISPAPRDVTDARQRFRRLHTVTGKGRADFAVPLGNGYPWVTKGVQTLVTRRQHLADAEFIAAFTGDVDELAAAVHSPVFTPYLGRQAYAPQFPFHLGVRDGGGLTVLAALPSTAPEGRPLRVYCLDAHRPIQVARIDPARTSTPLIDWKVP